MYAAGHPPQIYEGMFVLCLDSGRAYDRVTKRYVEGHLYVPTSLVENIYVALICWVYAYIYIYISDSELSVYFWVGRS